MKQVTSANQLNRRIQLLSQPTTSDGMGGFTSDWAVHATVWASIQGDLVKSHETVIGQQYTSKTVYIITIRYRPDVLESMRVQYGNHMYRIESMVDVDGKHVFMQLRCWEEEK